MNLVVVGAQWGDEGKGKIVDVLARDAEIICRYSGGANAGHTIVHGGSTYKLHLVPSGVVYDHTTVVLGTGMVIDPEALFHEIAELESVGLAVSGRILVSDRAHVVLPSHKAEDKARDDQRPRPLGTTGRGIGVAYAHKAYRTGVRVADIGWLDHTAALSATDREMLQRYGSRLTAMAVDLPEYMASVGRKKRVLLEGAQGALLDIDQGTYPYVSSGSSGAGGAAGGAGIGPRAIDGVLGVCKAYTTRVGNGPLPSELDADGPLEHHIREIGREYGVTTGRARRVGYLDLVALRYACRCNGIDRLAMTHLDVYDGIESLKVCVAYETPDDRTITTFPAATYRLEQVRPVTETLPGWTQTSAKAKTYDDLPSAAREYIAFVERYVGVPVGVVSVGYDRQDTILRSDPWSWGND